MPAPNDDDAIANRVAKSAAHRVCFWIGLLGLLLGFVVFALLITVMLAIRVMEGEAETPELQQVLYVTWVLLRHGVPLLLWIVFRKTLAHVPVAACVMLAIGCWLYSLAFIYALLNPVQW